MRPGTTKIATLGTGWVRLATLYSSDFGDAILSADGKEVANQAVVSVITNSGDIAYGTASPTTVGHPIASGDTWTMANQEFIKRAWLRNTTAGSAGVVIITPIFE